MGVLLKPEKSWKELLGTASKDLIIDKYTGLQ